MLAGVEALNFHGGGEHAHPACSAHFVGNLGFLGSFDLYTAKILTQDRWVGMYSSPEVSCPGESRTGQPEGMSLCGREVRREGRVQGEPTQHEDTVCA